MHASPRSAHLYALPSSPEGDGDVAARTASPLLTLPHARKLGTSIRATAQVFHDPVSVALLERVQRVAPSDANVVIIGATGTGKELIARHVHALSHRRDAPFVAVNCGAFSESLAESELFGHEKGAFTGAIAHKAGWFEAANGGTLFLDEIGDMPLALQGRLLRVLQERAVTPLGSQRVIPVDFALVCATNQPLREMAARHAFREDLYYRINGLQVKLPALRERSDLGALIDRILEQEGGRHAPRFDAQALALLQSSRWPGNLRQLSNLIRTALAMADGEAWIGVEHLPDDFLDEAAPLQAGCGMPAPAAHEETDEKPLSMHDSEWAAIERALRTHDGNVSAAAKALGVSRNTLYRRFKSRGH
ncbi:UNVERIFIED_CONTAM: sigma 54-interacting transcriptional regulator [Streptococcus suis]